MLNPFHDRSMSSAVWLLRSTPMFSKQLRDLSRSTCLMPSTWFRSIPCRTVDMFGGDFRRADERRFRENKPKDELRPLLRKWEGRAALKRDKAAPHIKTFFRYRETREDGECRSLALSPYTIGLVNDHSLACLAYLRRRTLASGLSPDTNPTTRVSSASARPSLRLPPCVCVGAQ